MDDFFNKIGLAEYDPTDIYAICKKAKENIEDISIKMSYRFVLKEKRKSNKYTYLLNKFIPFLTFKYKTFFQIRDKLVYFYKHPEEVSLSRYQRLCEVKKNMNYANYRYIDEYDFCNNIIQSIDNKKTPLVKLYLDVQKVNRITDIANW